MRKDKIQLWTVHPHDFSIIEGRVEHSRSTYYLNTPGVKKAYHELWHLLHIQDGQVIWCYTVEDYIAVTGEERIKWELCVPSSAVIRFIDDIVWNRILGIECNVRSDMRRKWRKEALAKYPNNSIASKTYEKQCLKNFWQQKPKSGSWWHELFVDDPEEAVSALIKHPVPIEWVAQKIILRSRERCRMRHP
jgi:hypothetical protein